MKAWRGERDGEWEMAKEEWEKEEDLKREKEGKEQFLEDGMREI